MPSITLQSVNQIDLTLALSVEEFKSRYLAGLPLPDTFSDEGLLFFLKSSQEEVENTLHLRILKQKIKESKDFYRDDWIQWGFIKASYPVHCGISVKGVLGLVTQVTFAQDWISVKQTNDRKSYGRTIEIVPNSNSAQSQLTIYSSILPNLYYMNSRNIPNYWNIEYVTGWHNPPEELLNAVGMLTAINVLQIISDALMAGTARMVQDSNGRTVLQTNGAMFGGIGLGMSSKSISLDGLSQSVSSFANGQTGIWGARLKQYQDQMNSVQPGSLMNRLIDQYGQFVLAVC